MKVSLPLELSNLTGDEFCKKCSQVLNDMITVINGHISLSFNTDSSIQIVTFTAINSQQPVAHKLNRLPVGYNVVGSSVAMKVYNDLAPGDTKNIYVRSDTLGTATIFVF